MAKLKITLVKSTIGRKKDQIATVEALGLKKIRSVVEHNDTPVSYTHLTLPTNSRA